MWGPTPPTWRVLLAFRTSGPVRETESQAAPGPGSSQQEHQGDQACAPAGVPPGTQLSCSCCHIKVCLLVLWTMTGLHHREFQPVQAHSVKSPRSPGGSCVTGPCPGSGGEGHVCGAACTSRGGQLSALPTPPPPCFQGPSQGAGDVFCLLCSSQGSLLLLPPLRSSSVSMVLYFSSGFRK